jgi:hypothetical protein
MALLQRAYDILNIHPLYDRIVECLGGGVLEHGIIGGQPGIFPDRPRLEHLIELPLDRAAISSLGAFVTFTALVRVVHACLIFQIHRIGRLFFTMYT